jgi:hypothetical protein
MKSKEIKLQREHNYGNGNSAILTRSIFNKAGLTGVIHANDLSASLPLNTFYIAVDHFFHGYWIVPLPPMIKSFI